jgi:uncharacterized coiled-coil protein SlyX
VSPSFAVKVSRIVNEYLVREEKDRCARLEAKNIDLNKKFEEERRKFEEERRKADEERRKADEHRLKFDEQCIKAEEERRKSEERYQNMCKRYGFQEEILGEVKHELVETKDKLEDVQESLELNTERLGHVEDKLGIAKEIVVPKEQNKDYHEMFTLLKRTDYDPTDEDDYEYYAICGQIKYVKTSRNRRMKTEGMVEVLSFEYTPNTKNILHRIKEQLRGFITCSGNKIDRNVRFSERRFVSRIREIEKERVDLMN